MARSLPTGLAVAIFQRGAGGFRMSKLVRPISGLVVALGLFAGSAYAGDVVYTDEGWYKVEGSEPTPTLDQAPALATEPATPTARTPAVQATERQQAAFNTSAGGQPAMPSMEPPGQQVPACLAERGALVRRMLVLHGLNVGTVEVTNAQLGAMGAVGAGAPLPFSASLSLDPDLNALAGNTPIPPSSINWDSEARWEWAELLRCENRG